jgi:hypothetical protein
MSQIIPEQPPQFNGVVHPEIEIEKIKKLPLKTIKEKYNQLYLYIVNLIMKNKKCNPTNEVVDVNQVTLDEMQLEAALDNTDESLRNKIYASISIMGEIGLSILEVVGKCLNGGKTRKTNKHNYKKSKKNKKNYKKSKKNKKNKKNYTKSQKNRRY